MKKKIIAIDNPYKCHFNGNTNAFFLRNNTSLFKLNTLDIISLKSYGFWIEDVDWINMKKISKP